MSDAAAVLAAESRKWLREVQDLRRRVRNPPSSAGPDALYNALVNVRANLDRIEELLADAISHKGAAEVRALELEQAADDAWDDIACRERRTMRRDFEGSKERYAYWNVEIREQRHRARTARQVADIAGDIERCIRLHYYGLGGFREDLNKRLAAVTAGWRNTES